MPRNEHELKTAMKYLKKLSRQDMSCEQLAEETGLSNSTVRQYRHLLIKAGYIESKHEYYSKIRDEMTKKYGLKKWQQRNIIPALKYKDILTSDLSFAEMAKTLNIEPLIVSRYRSVLIKLGLLERRKNAEILRIAQEYGLDEVDARRLKDALKYRDELANAQNGDERKKLANRLGLSVHTIATYRSALIKAGLLNNAGLSNNLKLSSRRPFPHECQNKEDYHNCHKPDYEQC